MIGEEEKTAPKSSLVLSSASKGVDNKRVRNKKDFFTVVTSLLKLEVTAATFYFQDIIVEISYNFCVKPTDLKSPFKFEERRPLLQDSVFFLPDYCTLDYELPWKPASIEFCSGNGDWIVERALLEPKRLFVAVEKRFDRVRKIWSKMKNHNIDNLLIVCGEAFTFLKNFVPNKGVEDVWINFPDPWPKRKHAKHRLMQKSFLDELARTVNGTITLATDDALYMERAQQLLDVHPKFEGGRCQLESYGVSYFDTLWRKKGREIFYATYGRTAEANREDLQRLRAELLHSASYAC